jgi:TetR/AcrR family transcriptional repressor of nem operon
MARISAKEKIINSTLDVMEGRGYRSVSVDEIITHAGVSKGSFYHSFKSKEELAMQALEEYERRGTEIISSGSYRQIEDPVIRAIAFVQYIEDRSMDLWEHGCLLGSVALEVAESHPKLLKKIDGLFEDFEHGIAGIFAPALRARKVRKISSKELSRHFLAVIEGAIVTAKTHGEPVFLSQGISHFKRYLEMILDAK